jgi:hypothetical protein
MSRRKPTNYTVTIGLYQDRAEPRIKALILEQPSGGYRLTGSKGGGPWDVVQRFTCTFTDADLRAAMVRIETLPSGDSDTPRTNALDMHIQSDAFMDGPQRPSGYELMCDLAAIFERQQAEALALLRELNDALAIPGWLQPRVDAVLDRAE